MAGRTFVAQSAAVSIAATNSKTIAALIAPANFDIIVRLAEVSGEGNDASQKPHLCELVTWTADGTGTSMTVNKGDRQDDTAVQTTGKHTYTVEPSGSEVVLYAAYAKPTGNLIFPGTIRVKAGTVIGWRITSPTGAATVNWRAGFGGEE